MFESYERLLAPHAEELDFRLPVLPAGVESAYHMFYVLLADNTARDSVLHRMREQGVQSTFHYVPLHSSEAGRRFAVRETECPVTTDISGRLLRLPFFNNLSADDIERASAVFLAAVSQASREVTAR
ncbi:MAG: DegT/DnrJ/EryC1/StrS family aminotransferase [Nocardioidaceae bacterium]